MTSIEKLKELLLKAKDTRSYDNLYSVYIDYRRIIEREHRAGRRGLIGYMEEFENISNKLTKGKLGDAQDYLISDIEAAIDTIEYSDRK